MQDSEAHHAKIELAVGNLRFSGEGDQDWLDQQIDKLIKLTGQVQTASEVADVTAHAEPGQHAPILTSSLATYLKEKGGEGVQVQRFLATAGWLWRRGEKPLTTRAVIKALQDNQQKRLGNPADCLNQNVGRGFCEKTNDGFFITPEGWAHLNEETK